MSVWMHGTRNEFDPASIDLGPGQSGNEVGIWLTTSIDVASGYGDRILNYSVAPQARIADLDDENALAEIADMLLSCGADEDVVAAWVSEIAQVDALNGDYHMIETNDIPVIEAVSDFLGYDGVQQMHPSGTHSTLLVFTPSALIVN